jgi:hypothetical protein
MNGVRFVSVFGHRCLEQRKTYQEVLDREGESENFILEEANVRILARDENGEKPSCVYYSLYIYIFFCFINI